MRVVYDLRADQDAIRGVQEATLTTPDRGLQQTHGLFGSREWWDNIRFGSLLVHRLVGVITQLDLGMYRDRDDFRAFDLTTDSGKKSRWACRSNSREQNYLYELGRRIEIDYVVQKRKQPWEGKIDTECEIEIRIDEASGPAKAVDDERRPSGVVPIAITNAFESARASCYPIGTLTTVLRPDGTLRQTVEIAPDLKRFNNCK